MPDLIHSLQNRDIGHLRIVAGLWGIELEATELDLALEELAASLLDPDLVHEVVDALPADARAALDALVEAEGRLPWVVFARRFGEVREVGAARRDRDQIYLSPVSAAEALFYRGLPGASLFRHFPRFAGIRLYPRGFHSSGPAPRAGPGRTR